MIKNIVEQIGAAELREMARLPKNFDLKLVDFEYGFRTKIEPVISLKIIDNLIIDKNQLSTAVELIVKAGVYYSLVLDIPKIKVHLSNYGISQHEQQKAKNAAWWDVRDLGLSWLKKADECLLQGLAIIKNEELIIKKDIAFFEQSFPLVGYEDINGVYPVSSAEVYLKLCRLMREAFDELMLNFKVCTAEFLLEDKNLAGLIKNYLINKSLLDAMNTQGLTFLSRGIVVQYEELPWQKSVVLSEVAYQNIARSFLKSSEIYLDRIWQYMREHADEFPCYTPPDASPRVKIERRKGGVFL